MIRSYKFKIHEYLYPTRLDWPLIINDILDKGLTKADIADLLGAPWSTLASWLDGVEPRESSGRSILSLHSRACGVEATIQRIAESSNLNKIEYLLEVIKEIPTTNHEKS